MKLPLILIAIGVIGVIGTIEYAQAESEAEITYHQPDHFDYQYIEIKKHNEHMRLWITVPCEGPIFHAQIRVNDYTEQDAVLIGKFNGEPRYVMQEPINEVNRAFFSNIQIPFKTLNTPIEVKAHHTDYWELSHTFNYWELCNLDEMFILKSETNSDEGIERQHTSNIIESLKLDNADLNRTIGNLLAQLNNTKDKVDNKIERKDLWKERYSICFDKKENLKTELERYKTSEPKMIHNIKQLQEMLNNSQTTIAGLQTNLTESQFTIEKLKQEKADLIKKVETLETQLSEN